MLKDGFDKKGKCLLCRKKRTEDGHDPCIANLPGVIYACCGHGEEKGYLKFEDGRCLRFFPVEIDLEAPTHEVVERVPIFINGERPKVLHFMKRKVVKAKSPHEIVETSTTSVQLRKRK